MNKNNVLRDARERACASDRVGSVPRSGGLGPSMTPGPTLLFVNAGVYPMTAPSDRADAVAVRDGKILAVGSAAALSALAGAGARRIDLGGRPLLPGFIDAHHHVLQAAIEGRGVSLERCRTIDEVLVRLREEAAATPPGHWVVAHGYDTRLLAEQRHPRRDELDDACPSHPALAVEYSHHEGVGNSLALRAAGYDRHAADPPAGRIERSPDGEPNGRLVETALLPVAQLGRADCIARNASAVVDQLAAYERALFAVGIVRVGDPAVDPIGEALYRRAVAEGRFRLPVLMMPVGRHGPFAPPSSRLDGAPTGEGPEHLRVGPLKLFMDGANRCAMCYGAHQVQALIGHAIARSARTGSVAPIESLRRRVRFDEQLVMHTGIRYYERTPLRDLVGAASERGFGVAIHAIGNEAVDYAIDALGSTRARHASRIPPRIEHANVITADLARRCGDLGIAVVAQPDFLRLPAFADVPPVPGLLHKALRTLRDAGVLVAGGSDAPVTGYDPLDGIRSAILRRTRSGARLEPEQALTAYEALDLYTRAAAIASGALDVTGTIEPGKRADLVVLSSDPCTASEDALDHIVVERTVLAGETVYERS